MKFIIKGVNDSPTATHVDHLVFNETSAGETQLSYEFKIVNSDKVGMNAFDRHREAKEATRKANLATLLKLVAVNDAKSKFRKLNNQRRKQKHRNK